MYRKQKLASLKWFCSTGLVYEMRVCVSVLFAPFVSAADLLIKTFLGEINFVAKLFFPSFWFIYV